MPVYKCVIIDLQHIPLLCLRTHPQNQHMYAQIYLCTHRIYICMHKYIYVQTEISAAHISAHIETMSTNVQQIHLSVHIYIYAYIYISYAHIDISAAHISTQSAPHI